MPAPASSDAGSAAPAATNRATRTGPTLVQRIKDKQPLLEYASRFTQLKPVPGSREEHMGRCPAPDHDDKGPSFYVNASKNIYHCHGCGITGNVIQLHALLHGLEVDDAKFELGRQLGVFHERTLDTAESMLSSAARRFADQLTRKEDALAYLQQERKISSESLERFNVGFCWGREFMDLKEVSQQRMAIDTGLAREETGKSFMAGRIVFPVRDRTGCTVGFGGRLVPSGFKTNGPKYINSPETQWFKKSELLYGAYEAAAGISKHGYAVAVEGYVDVIILHQHGANNAVSVMGASAHEETFKQLWSMTKRVVFCLDGDTAGEKGALRAVLKAAPTMEDGCEIAVAHLPPGKDPDEFIIEHGYAAWCQLCERAAPLSQYLMEARSAEFDLNYPEGRAAFIEEAKAVAGIFAQAPVLREQIVAEARAINAAALVDLALDTTGLAENVEPSVLRDAIALLQRRLNSLEGKAAPGAPALHRPRPRP